MNFQSSS